MKIYVAIFTVVCAGCVVKPENSRTVWQSVEGCWEYVTEQVPGIRNLMRMCVAKDVAVMQIYYPNNPSLLGGSPTTCIQYGVSEIIPSNNKFIISLEPGNCENGRELQSMRFGCDLKKDLVCRDREYFLRFKRVKNE